MVILFVCSIVSYNVINSWNIIIKIYAKFLKKIFCKAQGPKLLELVGRYERFRPSISSLREEL